MLGLLWRPRSRNTGAPGRATLRLEALEWRDQPSDIPLGTPPLSEAVYFSQGNTDRATPPANAPPQIVNFARQEIGNGMFLITGQVIDEAPNGLVVTFGGPTSGHGKTVTATADGTFSRTIQFEVNGLDSGSLTATTIDAQQQVSQEVAVFIDPTPP